MSKRNVGWIQDRVIVAFYPQYEILTMLHFLPDAARLFGLYLQPVPNWFRNSLQFNIMHTPWILTSWIIKINVHPVNWIRFTGLQSVSMGWSLGMWTFGGFGRPPSSRLLRSWVLIFWASSGDSLGSWGYSTGGGACSTGFGWRGAGYFLGGTCVHPIFYPTD